MFDYKTLFCQHKDLINDIAYNFYGDRMAVCSIDHTISVWNKSENDEWLICNQWKTHNGPVWRLCWSHPEFGSLIASCSFDRTVCIWEEVGKDIDSSRFKSKKDWIKKSNLADSRGSVTDVSFAPKHLGLLLASCSADEMLRIYNAPDPINLSHWTLQHEILVKFACSCLSWSTLKILAPLIAVGCNDHTISNENPDSLKIYEYCTSTRKWIEIMNKFNITSKVNDLAFAPSVGKSYHLLAVATDLALIIITIKVESNAIFGDNSTEKIIGNNGVAEFNKASYSFQKESLHDCSNVEKLSWNIHATLLATCDKIGVIKVFNTNFLSNWLCIAVIENSSSGIPIIKEPTNAHDANDPSSCLLDSVTNKSA